jgi:hypothetical protein
MRNLTLCSANGCRKTCCACGKSFRIRSGYAEATVGYDNSLYCYRTLCEEAALIPFVQLRGHGSINHHIA